jgi:hypothetical protein
VFNSLSLLPKLFLTLGLFADYDCDNDDSTLSKEQSFDALGSQSQWFY